ncbi:MAG TPA: acetolactate synthase large subunit [Burkholderiales bacterium]
MNGAESLVRTLIASGVDLCFANPGTSEMHFVNALDRVEGMRCVLGLFEGVVTGAADGYYRMAGKPAATLLHLGPGLGNGLANLHNARKAHSGILNIVGEHATYHTKYDAPLTADIEGIARPMSDWVKTSPSAQDIAADGALAVAAARTPPGQIATLILPADTAWNPGSGIAPALPVPVRKPVDADAVKQAARALAAGDAAILLGDVALREGALESAGRVAARTGCRLLAEYNYARMQRGAGRVRAERIPYAVDLALAALKGLKRIVLVGAKVPVSFFAYPNKPSMQAPEDCAFITLAGLGDDQAAALAALADELGAGKLAPAYVATLDRPALPTGQYSLDALGTLLGALLPENAIVIDEAVSSGRGFARFTANVPPHDWVPNSGGSIGFGLPVAVGAAIACPDRKVIALEGDGSGMYTLQALWTMARENLDVTVLIFANRAYNILRGELANVGAGTPGVRATDMLTLDRPDLDWLALAKGQGVEAGRAANLDELATQFKRALARKGPYLIEIAM